MTMSALPLYLTIALSNFPAIAIGIDEGHRNPCIILILGRIITELLFDDIHGTITPLIFTPRGWY